MRTGHINPSLCLNDGGKKDMLCVLLVLLKMPPDMHLLLFMEEESFQFLSIYHLSTDYSFCHRFAQWALERHPRETESFTLICAA